MKNTISDLFQVELASRLVSYERSVKDADPGTRDAVREQCNHRYLCIQTAAWMQDGGKAPAIIKPVEEVHEELRRWMRTMQAGATVETQYGIARDLALITEFIEQTKPVSAGPVQTTLV